MLDSDQLDAQWREGLDVLATRLAATVPPGAPARVEQRMHARARTRVVRRSATSVIALAAIIAFVVVLFGRTSDNGAHTAPANKHRLTACTPVKSVVTVQALASLKFSASTYQASAGCVQIDYSGAAGHTLAFDPPGPSGPVLQSSAGNGPTRFAWNLRTGTYTLYCIIPGHRAAGMQATLTVR